jgi:predicted  nucleic acid-binding Zn-ribbon protein|tara:strand:- start:196 stop:618 length:423 start_codon:yes stop_codon:yes gene_type:complete
MTVNTPPEDEGRGLRDRLADIPRDRLVDEVVSRWDDMIRLEGEVANLRRRVREAELVAQSGGSDGVVIGDLEERLRVADSRIRQLEGLVQNEKSRREGAEADSSRLAELQEENSRLLRNEEELLLLVLDMEAQIDRLVRD